MRRAWRSMGTATAALVLAESARRAHTHRVSPHEERVFRTFNDGPDEIHVPVWAVMQSGSLAGVYVVAAELVRQRRPRDATATAIAGTAVWGGVKLIKPHVGRGRPSHLLERVSVRGQEQTGLGYPSGHAAVATTLAHVVTRHATGPARAWGFAIAAFTGSSRMYVGAHLPLDVVGGLAIGMLSGRLANAALDGCGD